uniref:Prepropeptide n=1 Tax=Tripedalia cystophora TaxID=6141 RepID=A0A482A7Q1_TRICY|nr:prepropeptide [Tripedalia cystophora]
MDGFYVFLLLVIGTCFFCPSFTKGECNTDSTDYAFKRSDCLEELLGLEPSEFADFLDEQPRSGKRELSAQDYRPRAGREGDQDYRPRAGRQVLTRPRGGREYSERPRAGREYTIKIISSESQSYGRPRAGRESAARPRAGRENLERPRAGRESLVRPRAGREDIERPRAGREDLERPRAGREDLERPRAGRQMVGRPRAGREFFERPRAGRNVVLILNDDDNKDKNKRSFYIRSKLHAESQHDVSGSHEEEKGGELLDERESNHFVDAMDEKAATFINENQPRSGKRDLTGKTALALRLKREGEAIRSAMGRISGYNYGFSGYDDEMNNQPRSGKRSIRMGKHSIGRPRAGREDSSEMKRGLNFPVEEDGQKLVFLMANKRENRKNDFSKELEKLAGNLSKKRREAA